MRFALWFLLRSISNADCLVRTENPDTAGLGARISLFFHKADLGVRLQCIKISVQDGVSVEVDVIPAAVMILP